MADPEFLAALRASASEVLDDQCPIERVQRHIGGDEPYAADLWRTVVDLGWTMITVPDAFGGMGGGVAELAVVQEAVGAHVAPLPLLGTALLALGVSAWPDRALAGEVLLAIAGGEAVGGVADPTGGAPLKVSRAGRDLVLDGEVSVLDGAAADWLLLPTEDRDTRARGLALLRTDAPGIERVCRPIADCTRSVAAVRCRASPLETRSLLLGEAAERTAVELAQFARLLLASDSVGGSRAILELTADYLKTRVQFGKPIGAFQALKHRAADLKVAFEMSRTLAHGALERWNLTAAPDWAAMAKASACETYLAIASEAVQMHGGIGFTWEHPAHLYLKRAALNRALFGDTAALQDGIAAGLLAGAA